MSADFDICTYKQRSVLLYMYHSYLKLTRFQMVHLDSIRKTFTDRSEKLGDNWSQDMRIVPVNFNSEHKPMLGHCKMILENDGGRIAINPDRV
jgi:hypothetical protein